MLRHAKMIEQIYTIKQQNIYGGIMKVGILDSDFMLLPWIYRKHQETLI